ncbi:hypothetical protein F4859DRAFT_228425 [Xylaria cf. heliscus]|nr:hypothetical protein F4859DRAFT_228425 [Xylaria cf. heliscus]
MDIIITGATGFVGGAVVRQAIAHGFIEHAFVLTRKPLPEDITNHERITVIEHDDFFTWPPELMERLAGCEACIWCIGGRAYQFPDMGTAKLVSVDYPMAAATAFLTSLAPTRSGGKFRFVLVSGQFAEWDENKSLFFLSDTRRLKGTAEKRLLELASANQDRFDVVVTRPGGIMAPDGGCVKSTLGKLTGFISVDHFASNLIVIAREGARQPIIEHKELMAM